MKSAGSWFSKFGFRASTSGVQYITFATPEQIRGYLASQAENAPSSAMGVSAVWACVNLLSRSIATLPAALYKRDKSGRMIVAEEHAAHRLMAVRPNQILSPFELFQILVAHLLLKGNFYAEKVMFGGKIQSLLPLEPDRCEPKMGADGVLFYEYSQPGRPVRKYRQDEILHVRGLTVDGLKGLSVVGAARRAIEGSVATERYGSSMFSNGAKPSGVLEIDTELSEEAQTRLRNQFDATYAGLENAHKTMVLEAGLKWKPITLNAEDTQFIESRKFARSEIAMFFGVPPHLIGDIDRGTSWGSGIEQQNRGFLIYTLRPYLANIAQAFVRDLLPEKDQGKYVVRFDTSDLERADFGPRQTGLEVMRRNGVINANEWRRFEGFNPRDDEAADQYVNPGASQGQGADAPADDPGQSQDAGNRPDPTENQDRAARRAPLAVVR